MPMFTLIRSPESNKRFCLGLVVITMQLHYKRFAGLADSNGFIFLNGQHLSFEQLEESILIYLFDYTFLDYC